MYSSPSRVVLGRCGSIRLFSTGLPFNPAPQPFKFTPAPTKPEWITTVKNQKTGFSAHFIGVDYNKPTNSEEVWKIMNSLTDVRKGPAPVILMESYNCMCEEDIASGQVIPYPKTVPKNGTQKAIQRLKDPIFRSRLSGEVMAVIHALGMKLDVVFCDRNCVLSVDRMINRYSVDELEQRAAQGIKKVINEAVAGNIPVMMVQNSMLPSFPELFQERHLVMAHFARKATETTNAVVVVGGQHIQHVSSKWDLPIDIDELLSVSPLNHDVQDLQLRKRALMMALFATTSAFPVEAVTVSIADINDEDTEKVKRHYTEYRKMFQRAMTQTAMSRNEMEKIVQQRSEAQGLSHLTELLEYFEHN